MPGLSVSEAAGVPIGTVLQRIVSEASSLLGVKGGV